MFCIPNSYHFCTALLKATCCFSQMSPNHQQQQQQQRGHPMATPSNYNSPTFPYIDHSSENTLNQDRDLHHQQALSYKDSSKLPRSQGIAIVGGRGTHRRRSSSKKASFDSYGSHGHFGSGMKHGSFLRSAAHINSYASSLNSWSVWNSGSFGSRMTAESMRSWVWVKTRSDSELSGECVCVHMHTNKQSHVHTLMHKHMHTHRL